MIIYNNFLTLGGIPPENFTRSGITNDPNRADDPEYIVRLIKKVVTVSVETVKIVKGLPELSEKIST
jgi:hypothetical protein